MECQQTDDDDVITWRWEQALAHGLDVDDAERFALSDGDLETLRRLIRDRGCDPHVAALIVS